MPRPVPCRFGEVAECTKRPGSTLAFVHFAQAADAARAKEAVHYRVVSGMAMQIWCNALQQMTQR